MNLSPEVTAFWKAFTATQAVDPTPRFYEAFHFDDNEKSANALARLVLNGTKRATAALVWQYENWAKPIPKPGDLSIVTDFAGHPLCVIESHTVDIVPFNEVTKTFAAIEGEGDGSLAYWRTAHKDYFRRECTRIGHPFTANTLVVCEQFNLKSPNPIP